VNPAALLSVAIWVVPWDGPPVLPAACFNEVSPFAYSFSSGGETLPVKAGFIEESRKKLPPGALFIPAVVNDVLAEGGNKRGLKSVALLERLLRDPARRSAHAAELLALVDSNGYDGLEIDYERIPAGLWEPFLSFIKELAPELHKRGKKLHVDLEAGLLARRGRPEPTYWPELAEHADRLNLMMYYERGNFRGSPPGPGPGASLAWLRDIGKRAVGLLPPEKLSFAFSLAAQTYPKFSRIQYGKALELQDKHRASAERDEKLGSPFFRYGSSEVWFEDDRSVAARMRLARELGVRQVSLWYIGARHPDLSAICSAR
jgi:spore germination protein